MDEPVGLDGGIAWISSLNWQNLQPARATIKLS